ncbi:MAG: serine/threonine-protein kinase [Arenicellales bacterium]
MKYFKLKKTNENAKLVAKKQAAAKLANRAKPDPRKPLKENTQVEEYTMGKVIGRGSFSVVYQATHTESGQKVVIKEYFPKHFGKRIENDVILPLDGKKLFTFKEGFRQFFNEAMALNKITHPNVLKTSNVFRANKTAYLVSTNHGGRDLKWFLSSTREKLDQDMIYRVFMPILSALNFLHNAELLHLDIKPANILLQPNGESLLLDFGAAQSMSSSKRINRMQTLTHGFAPPEQYDKNRQLGPWTDIYAVAATLYYCIACQPPVKSKDSEKATQLDIKQFSKDYTPDMLVAINTALSFDATTRHDNADAFAQDMLKDSPWETLRDYELKVMGFDRFEKSSTDSQQALASAVA